MDNLTHALIGTIATANVFPKAIKENKKKLILASAITANLPDIDIILGFFGENTYHFHHRGFTHSVLGFLTLMPINYLILKKLLFNKDKIKREVKTKLLLLSSFQLIISHFFFDYITTYGVMFLYPIMDRFSYPMLFIIDPLLWLVLGLTVYFTFRSSKKIRILFSVIPIISFLIFQQSIKSSAESKVREKYAEFFQGQSNRKIDSYPGPLYLYYLVNSIEDNQLKQFTHSMFTDKTQYFEVKQNYSFNSPCDLIKDDSNVALSEFDKYLTWSENLVCKSEVDYCKCHAIKYTLVNLQPEGSFGTITLTPNGELNFFRPNNLDSINRMKKVFEN